MGRPAGALEAALSHYVSPPDSWRRTRLIRTGPDLWLARYAFEGLRLRDPDTGRVYRHNGFLEVEILITPSGPAARYALLESDSLPPPV